MPRMKVMTLNLWGFRADWPARRDRLISLMQQEEIDVLLLQEVSERLWRTNQALEIANLTGYAAAYVPAQRYLPLSLANGLAILSRFPISNQLAAELVAQRGPIPTGNYERRIAQRVEIALDGMSLLVYNTHFPLRSEDRRQAAARLWGQVAREEAVLVVVGGDFNAHPGEEAITFLVGKTYIDGLRGELADAWATAGVGPAETFPLPTPSARIDYIFYQAEPSVIVQESKVVALPPAEVSDHAAVIATFAISPARDPRIPFEEEPVASLEPTGGGLRGGL